MSKPLSCLFLLLHFLSPWVTLFFCACDMQKCHGEADNSTSFSESREGEERRATSSRLKLQNLCASSAEMSKRNPFCPPLLINLLQGVEPTAFFWKRSPIAPWYTFEGVWELSWLLFIYTSAIQSTSKPLLGSTLGYPRYEKYSMKPISMLIQT